MSNPLNDTPVSPPPAEPEAPMTHGEQYERIKALEAKLEKLASKTTLVMFVATRCVSSAWWLHGRRSAIDEAEAKLLTEIKDWVKTSRERNALRRITSRLKKHDENMAAINAGRRPPHKFKTPKRRKARRAKP